MDQSNNQIEDNQMKLKIIAEKLPRKAHFFGDEYILINLPNAIFTMRLLHSFSKFKMNHLVLIISEDVCMRNN